MRKVKFLELYLLLFVYIILKIVLKDFIPFRTIISPLFLLVITIYLYIRTNSYHGRFNKLKDNQKKLLIIMLIYMILYILLGLVIGFTKSPYSIMPTALIKNIWQMVLPLFCIEYARSVMFNYNNKNKLYIFLAFLIIFVVELDINLLIYSIHNFAELFKYTFSTLLPLIFMQIILSYLVLKGSYKLTIIIRGIIIFMTILLPIYPDVDWFSEGVIGLLLPVVIYVIFKYDIDKRVRAVRKTSKVGNPLNYIFTFIFVILLSGFMMGVFIYKPIAIASNSMVPIFYRGDVVILRKADDKVINNLELYDIIVYRIGNQRVVHRIVDIKEYNGEKVFKTKGDANTSPDREFVKMDQVDGVYKFSIKYIGYPSIWLNQLFNKEEAKVETG